MTERRDTDRTENEGALDTALATEPITAEALDWPAPEPPPGFAERATAAFLEREPAPASRPSPRSRSTTAWIAVGAAVAAALVLWLAMPRGTASSDALTTDVQQTVSMGERAVAVASPGSVLRWSVDDDGVTAVEQDAGRVFYRVDHGGAFEVKTPAGTVRVTGTCFEVENRPMKNKSTIKGAALGAALASAVVVTVYEGGVVLANERGEVAVGPGDKARAEPGDAPRRWADSDESPTEVAAATAPTQDDPDGAAGQVARQARALEQARADAVAKEQEIAQLRQQVTDLGGDPGQPGPLELEARARRCATQGRFGDCPFLDPDEETLREMAKCASVKVDFPGFLDNVDSPRVDGYAKSLGISDPAEVAALQRAADAHYTDFNARLRQIFVELGGDPAMAEDASAATMKSFIADQLDNDLMGEVQRRVAEERAGMREPPADPSALSIEEQAFRLHAELGNDFEGYLAKELGPSRAHELRAVQDGWPGSTSVSSGDCVE